MNRTFATLPAFVLLALLAPTRAHAQVPSPPYGMDAVPNSVFFTGRWNHYGSDPVPHSETNPRGFRGAYGLDVIPDGVVPHLQRLKDTLPAQHLQVLPRAIEQTPRPSTAAP